MPKAFYDRISGVYDLISDASEAAARSLGVEALAPASGERVLEIGFGTGHVLLELAQAVGPGGAVAGVDVSTGMHEVAARRVAAAGFTDRVALQLGEVPPLPYPDDSFDAVYTSFTLELFEPDTIPLVLQEVRRVTVAGGRLALVSMDVTPSGEHESVLTHTYKWMHRHFPHIVDCQPIDAREVLRAAGFELLTQEELKIWTLPVAVIVGASPA